jgi:phage gpG-like protein
MAASDGAEFKKFGQWEMVGGFLGNLAERIDGALKKATHLNAMRVQRRLVLHLQNQDLVPETWPHLNPAYKAKKVKEGFSDNVLIRTSSLLNSISMQSAVVKTQGGLSAWVGVNRTARNKDGESLVNIAAVHEFGSLKANIPARPLFRTTYQEMAQEIQDRYRRAILTVLGLPPNLANSGQYITPDPPKPTPPAMEE